MYDFQEHHKKIKAEFKSQSINWDQVESQELVDIVSTLDLEPHFKVLDVAAGSGLFSRALSSQVLSITALDISPDMIKQGEKINSRLAINNIHFEEGSAERMPFEDNQFDCVVTRFSIHHFLDPSVILAEMARVHNGKGPVVIVDITAPEDEDNAREYNRIEILRDSTHTRAYSAQGLAQLAENAGLTVSRTDRLDVEMDLIEWYDKVHLGADGRKEIDELMQRDLSSDYQSGMDPLLVDQKIKFVHHWAIVVAR